MKCIRCKGQLQLTGYTGSDYKVDSFCPSCGIYYFEEIPVAIQKGNIIKKLPDLK